MNSRRNLNNEDYIIDIATMALCKRWWQGKKRQKSKNKAIREIWT